MGKVRRGNWLITYNAVWHAGYDGPLQLYNQKYTVINWLESDTPYFFQPNGIYTPTFITSAIDPLKRIYFSGKGFISMLSKVFTPLSVDCSDDSCRVDCATSPDGFCCIDHVVTNRLLQVLQG